MPHNNFLHSSCFNIPGAPEQLPAFIWFYIWFHRGLLKSPPPVPLHSFPHSCGFNISASPRLSPASCMRRHLGSISRLPLLVSATSCVHPCFDVKLPPLPPASFSPIFCGHLASISTCSPVSLNTFLHASCLKI